jgi:hypothetical protein
MNYPEPHKIHAGCPGVQAAASAVCLSTSGRHDLRPRPDHRRPDDPHAHEGLVQQPRHRVRARRQDGAWRKKRSDAGKPRASKPVSLFAWPFEQADRHEGQVASACPSTNSELKIH